MNPAPAKPEIYKWIRTAGLLSFIPFVLASGPLAGYFAGEYFVKSLKWPEYVLYISITVGFAAGVNETIRIIRLVISSQGK